MKVFVDPAKCRGHARCVAILPEVFGWNDTDDRAVVSEDADLSGLDELLWRAATNCPEQAIRVEE